VVVYGSTNHSHMCAHRIAAAGGIRRERERVFTAHTINTGVPLMRGEATVTSSISLQALGARHDRSTTYVGVYGGRGKGVLGFYRDISSPSSPSCCCHRAMRHSNGAKDAPRSSPIGCNVAWHMRIPLHKREHQSHRWRESDRAEETHGQPSMCVGSSARGGVSPLIQLLHNRVVCDPKETRLARDKHPPAPSRTEQQAGGRR